MTRKPEHKDFPPESPHDLEWGGYNHEKYSAALEAWSKRQEPDEMELFEKAFYWTKDEVKCYNKGIEDALAEVERFNTGKELTPLVSQIISKITALKKQIQ